MEITERVQITTDVVTEPVTLATAKQFCRVDTSDDDTLFTSIWIPNARKYVETRLNQTIATTTYLWYRDSFMPLNRYGYYARQVRESGEGPLWIGQNRHSINVPRPPLVAINSIQYYDFSGTLQTLSSAQYNVSTGVPARIQPVYSQIWPIPQPRNDAVQISMTCGYGGSGIPLPANVLEAMLIVLAEYYERRVISSEIPLQVTESILDRVLAPTDHGSYY